MWDNYIFESFMEIEITYLFITLVLKIWFLIFCKITILESDIKHNRKSTVTFHNT